MPVRAIVIDIRHPDDCYVKPLVLPESKRQPKIVEMPFFKLSAGFSKLDQNKQYLLYRERGSMSRIPAKYLAESGFSNVSVLNLEAKYQA
jgi:thiazole biosynthesis-like protein